jgi:hypothetical protein
MTSLAVRSRMAFQSSWSFSIGGVVAVPPNA